MRERNLNGKEMMEKCKHCAGNKLIKNGFEKSKQRYKCKCCKRTCREGDERVKYTLEKKIRVLKWYLEGAGIRSIERMEEVSATLIVYWIRKMGSMLREKIESLQKCWRKQRMWRYWKWTSYLAIAKKNFQSVRMACC